MKTEKIFNAFVANNQELYYSFVVTSADELVKSFRRQNVDMYYLNQAEKFAAELRFIAKDNGETFDFDYFNNKVSRGFDQIKGWINEDFTPADVQLICRAFLANFN